MHNQYIDYVESLNLPKGICNISGEEQQLTSKHRGLLGNAKLISVSNNKENYQGRFSNGEDIISVGYKTSEKIHLMLKFLLENRNTNIR
ncbi:type I-C CRISPR-associated protein Cas8c/Csd1, partial [Enterococcus cecorum]